MSWSKCSILSVLTVLLMVSCARIETRGQTVAQVSGPAGFIHIDDGGAGGVPHVLAQIQSERQCLPRAASLSFIQAIFDYDPEPALQRFNGSQLAVITPDQANPYDLHRLMADLPHKMVIGTSHWLHMDKPEEFNLILDDFLEEVHQGH